MNIGGNREKSVKVSLKSKIMFFTFSIKALNPKATIVGVFDKGKILVVLTAYCANGSSGNKKIESSPKNRGVEIENKVSTCERL